MDVTLTKRPVGLELGVEVGVASPMTGSKVSFAVCTHRRRWTVTSNFAAPAKCLLGPDDQRQVVCPDDKEKSADGLTRYALGDLRLTRRAEGIWEQHAIDKAISVGSAL